MVLENIGLIVAGIVVVGAVIYFWRKKDMVKNVASKGIPAKKGFEAVQKYLDKSPGKYEIDPKSEENLEEGVLNLDLGGETLQYYGVIGRVNRPDQLPYNIRVIWNLTEDDFVWFTGDVPDYEDDPFFNRDEWLKTEGYRYRRRDKDDDRGPLVNVNYPSSNGSESVGEEDGG